MTPTTRLLPPFLFAPLLMASASGQAQSLMAVQEQQAQPYKDCKAASTDMLGARDIDGDGDDEFISLYAFEDCPDNMKPITFFAVFYKKDKEWRVAKGDTVLSDKATLYILESAEDGVITLKHAFDDNVPLARFRYSGGKVERLK